MRQADRVHFATYNDEIEALFGVLRDCGIDPKRTSELNKDAYEAFALLYYHVFADERPADVSGVDLARANAGLGDIAAKINKAVRSGHLGAIKPHLLEMVKGSPLMNRRSGGMADAADKTSELYLGCLALNAGLSDVEIEHPVRSADGSNPDILLSSGSRPWAIAVKTMHGNSFPTMFQRISEGAEQVERSGRDGFVLINLKNRMDNASLIDPSLVYESEQSAVGIVTSVLKGMAEGVRNAIVDSDWSSLFRDARARPIIALTGQSLVTVSVDEQKFWTPVRVIQVLRVPPAPSSPEPLTGMDHEVVELLSKLNHELQWNPSHAQ